MNFNKVFLILDIIEEQQHLSTLIKDKIVIYNFFENKVKNNHWPFDAISGEYKLIKLLVEREYINGQIVMDDDPNLTLGMVIAGVPYNKIMIRGLTKKGRKLRGDKARWYLDKIQSYLKDYDEITKIILMIIASLITFCSGAVMAWGLNNLLK